MRLYEILALRSDYPVGTCWAWMDSAERRCSKPAGAHENLCDRHAKVAQGRLDKARAKRVAKVARLRERAVRDLDANRRKLADLDAALDRVEARMRQLDPPPPTTDPAAWGGVGNSASARYRRRATSDRVVMEMAELVSRRDQIRTRIFFVRADIDLAATQPKAGAR